MAARLSQDDLRGILSRLEKRYQPLFDLIKVRDAHFYNEASAAPRFGEPYHDLPTWQTDLLRQTHTKLKARLTESHFRVHCRPPEDSRSQREAADRLEAVLETSIELSEERFHTDIRGALADGMLLHCYGVLHWTWDTDHWPAFPDAETRENKPLDATEAKRFRQDGQGFSETDESRLERDQRAKARAGAPWRFEVLRPDWVIPVEDRGPAPGLAAVAVFRTVPMLEYSASLRERDHKVLSLNAQDKRLRIYEEKEAPPEEAGVDRQAWGKDVRVAQFWTRDDYYEVVTMARKPTNEWLLVKSFAHHWDAPPFAFAYASRLNHPDPVKAYEPALQGVFRMKPSLDYERTLGRFGAEQTMLKRYWIELADGTFLTDTAGDKQILSQNAAQAKVLPAGAKLVAAQVSVDPAFVAFLKMSQDDVLDARPETGFVEVGSATAPHTVSMLQQQANSTVVRLSASMAGAMREALRSITARLSKPLSEGGPGESVMVYAKVKRGKVQPGTMTGVDPDRIPGLDLDVSLNPWSGSQRTALIEFGRGLLADPNVPLTDIDFVQDYMMEENATEVIAAYERRQLERQFLPQLAQQTLAGRFAKRFVLTPQGTAAGVGGLEATPQQVLAANGWSPRPAPSPPPAGGQTPGETALEPLTPLGQLQPLRPNGPVQ